jgi:hypothetical protein
VCICVCVCAYVCARMFFSTIYWCVNICSALPYLVFYMQLSKLQEQDAKKAGACVRVCVRACVRTRKCNLFCECATLLF